MVVGRCQLARIRYGSARNNYPARRRNVLNGTPIAVPFRTPSVRPERFVFPEAEESNRLVQFC